MASPVLVLLPLPFPSSEAYQLVTPLFSPLMGTASAKLKEITFPSSFFLFLPLPFYWTLLPKMDWFSPLLFLSFSSRRLDSF